MDDRALIHAPYAEGPLDFSIGLRPIAAAAWLEGGEADPAARKDALFAAEPAAVWAQTPGSLPGQLEVAEMIEAAGITVDRRADLPPLYAAARAVPDDLCLMEKRDGVWRLAALSLSAGSLFTAAEAIGKSLGELHGPVPDFGRELLPRVERIFDALRPDLILERRNWSVINSGDLFAPDATPIRARIGEITPEAAGSALFLRMERQTLRRLPATGGALFTIRIWRHTLAALKHRPGGVAAFATAWRGASERFRAYKKLALYDDLVAAFLRAEGE